MNAYNRIKTMRKKTDEDARALVREWIHALEDDSNLQGQISLEYIDNDGNVRRCCLGLLCHVYGLNAEFGPLFAHQSELATEGRMYEGHSAMPPDHVLAAAAIDDPWILSEMNDVEKLSYRQIAEYLRSDYAIDD